MTYPMGTKLTDLETGAVFTVSDSNTLHTYYVSSKGQSGYVNTQKITDIFYVTVPDAPEQTTSAGASLVIYPPGTKLTDKRTGAIFFVIAYSEQETKYKGAYGEGVIDTPEVPHRFVIDWGPEALESAMDVQIGGDHYKKFGVYQPWEVLRRWLTPEEFRGYMKGTALSYLAREHDKGGLEDIKKASHTLQGLIEILEGIHGRS